MDMSKNAKTSKINIFTRALSLMIALILAVQLNNSMTIQAASDKINAQSSHEMSDSGMGQYNGATGGIANPSSLPYAGSVGRSGIIFYVVEAETESNHSFTPYKLKNGTQLKPIVFMDESQKTKDIKTTLNTTRNGSITFTKNDINAYPDELPPPIKWDGSTWTGNGEEIGEYLLTKSEDFTDYGVELLNWEVLLANYGGDNWEDLIDELKETDSKLTLCVEVLSENYIYHRPVQVKIRQYTKQMTYKGKQILTKHITTNNGQTVTSWTDTYETIQNWTEGAETATGTEATFPDGDTNGCYYVPYHLNGEPNVYFGSQIGLANSGSSIERIIPTDLSQLKSRITDGDNPEFDDNSSFTAEYGENELVKTIGEENNSYGPVVTNCGGWNYPVKTSDPLTYHDSNSMTNGMSCWREYTSTQTKTYTKYTIEPVDDNISNWKWMQIVLPWSLCLDHEQLGISKPDMAFNDGTPVGFPLLTRNTGFGISMFNDELEREPIHTYWEESPGNTEPPVSNKKGYNKVVKGYMTITKDSLGNVVSEEASGLYERKLMSKSESDTVCNDIIIDQENPYKVKHWWVTDTYGATTEKNLYNVHMGRGGSIPGSSKDPGSGTAPTQVKLDGKKDNQGRCLYILLVRVITLPPEKTGDTIEIQLEQSEITKKVDFDNENKGIIKAGSSVFKSYRFAYRLDAYAEQQGICPGHNLESKDDRIDETQNSKFCVWNWDDNSITYALKPHDNYERRIFVSRDDWKPIVTTNANSGAYDTTEQKTAQKMADTRRTATNNHEMHYPGGWNFVTVIHRGDDPITLFKWKNDKIHAKNSNWTANSDLVGIDKIAIANSKQGARNTTAEYSIETSLEIVRNTLLDDLTTVRKNMQNRGGGSSNACESLTERGGDLLKGDISQFVGVNALYKNRPNTFDVKVTYKTYSGKADYAGTDTVNNPETKGVVKSSDLTISPYIYMRYQTTSGEIGGNQKVSAVLGNYDRTVKNMFSSAELKDNKDWDKGLMKLDSLQWSTHKRAEDTHEVSTVLPGGATFTLSVPTNNRKKVHLWTYQPVLVGDGKGMQEATKGVPNEFTLDQAKANHNGAVSDVLTAMNNLHIQQFQLAKDLGKPNPNEIYLTENDADTQCVFDGINEQGHEPVFNNTNMSTDEKYYLRGNKKESNSSYIDARATTTKTRYYTIYADASDGKLYLKESTDPEQCTAKDGIEITANNDEIKALVARIDSKTGIVTALKNALERGSGSDTGAEGNYNPPLWATSDGKWYNEAFDGITMVEMDTELELGLVDTAERSSVLDPKLTPSSENGRESMLTKFHTAQFLTEDHSELGTFKGTSIPVVNGTTKHWLHSKLFYVPNATTQDLK